MLATPALFATPRTLLWDASTLERQPPAAALTELLAVADAALEEGPWAVTDKQMLPPSGDRHDFFSTSSYAWPCNRTCPFTFADCSHWCMPPLALVNHVCVDRNVSCDAGTGLPWVTHDGYSDRSASAALDRPRMDGVTTAVAKLVLAWWYTSSADPPRAQRYVARAAELLRTFFLRAESAMDPNLNFAQGLPGSYTHRT